MLSMKAKYALRALVVLARDTTQVMRTKAIASQADIPAKFLETILSDLKNHGIVTSKRGMLGGYSLAKLASAITIGDIVRMMDGPLAPIRCASVTAYQRCEDCPDEQHCSIHHVMKDVRQAMSDILDHRTIQDMLMIEAP